MHWWDIVLTESVDGEKDSDDHNTPQAFWLKSKNYYAFPTIEAEYTPQ